MFDDALQNMFFVDDIEPEGFLHFIHLASEIFVCVEINLLASFL
jgi:hypothetical protein